MNLLKYRSQKNIDKPYNFLKSTKITISTNVKRIFLILIIISEKEQRIEKRKTKVNKFWIWLKFFFMKLRFWLDHALFHALAFSTRSIKNYI